MEEQSNQENPSQMMSFSSGGTSSHVCRSTEDVTPAGGRNGNGRQWTCLPEPFHNYVEYLTESSTYLPNTTTQYVLGSCYPSLDSLHDVSGVNGTDRNLFYNNDPGKACGFKPPDASTEIDFRNVKTEDIEQKIINSSKSIGDIAFQRVGFRRPDNEGYQGKKLATNQHYLHDMSQASWKAESTEDKHSVSQPDPRLPVGAPGLLKPRSSSSKQKASATDRQRRQRIADNLKALHDLLPTPAEGSQAYILDDIIDYVKYLQLQIKELSGSKLRGESTAMPLTFREGYGHYINQQMLNEPLEEMMGKLVEEHPVAAAQLLESKGLFLLPLSLVEDLSQAMQMFGGIPRG